MFEDHRFSTSLAGLGLPPHPAVFLELLEAYSGATRHYHDTSHVSECLRHLDRHRGEAVRPFEIEVALWFHDAVYDTSKLDNEERSADWAHRFLDAAGSDPSVSNRVAAMIRATQTHEATDADSALMLDIDLGILGAPRAVFEDYDAAIRREYHWVPEEQYRVGRRKVLSGFLSRTAIYQTSSFRELYEEQARRNLEATIDELSE